MGAPVGEPAYMAPEQLRDQPASPESDFWALGVLLYEMLAGRPACEASSFPLVAHQVVLLNPPPVMGVSAEVQMVLDKALEKEPEKRYRRAGDLVTALRKASGTSASLPLPRLSRPVEASAGQSVTGLRLQGKTSLMLGACGLALAAALAIGIRLFGSAPGAPAIAKAAVISVTAPSAPAKPLPSPAPVAPRHPSVGSPFLNSK